MKTAIVVGAGIQGSAIAYALAYLGMEVYVKDIDWIKAKETVDKIHKLDLPAVLTTDEIFPVDVLVSAAPYHQNYEIAFQCFEQNIRYCDLGGNVEVSQRIQAEATTPTFTDLGLAPGYVNILAEQMADKHEDKTPAYVRIFVGGLPANPTGTLKYGLSFSTAGLKNEYSGDCEILKDGEKILVPALSGVERIGISGKVFEAFHTSGGFTPSALDSMKNKGVRNCCYKTLRYPGHCDVIKFLLQDLNLNQEEFDEIITKTCPPAKDEVYVYIKIGSNDKKGNAYSVVDPRKCVADDNWTAMQKSTAFPTAAVAYLMAEGKFDDKMSLRLLAKDKTALRYSDIPFDEFTELLKKIN